MGIACRDQGSSFNEGDGASVFANNVTSRGVECNPSVLDFGTVEVSASIKVKREVSVVNRTAATIRIDKIQADCGCAVVGVSAPLELEPSQSVSIPVELSIKPSDNPGPHVRNLLITTDVDGQTAMAVPLKVHIAEGNQLSAIPASLDFGDLGKWESKTLEFSISHRLPHKLSMISASTPYEGVSVANIGRNELGELRFAVTVSGDGSASSSQTNLCEIETTHGKCKIALRWRRLGEVPVVSPEILVFSNSSGVRNLTCKWPKRFGSNDLEILVKDGDNFTVSRLEGDKQATESMQFAVTKSGENASMRSSIVIRSKSTRAETQVPVFIR